MWSRTPLPAGAGAQGLSFPGLMQGGRSPEDRTWPFWAAGGPHVQPMAVSLQPPTSLAALGNSCVTVACASMPAGAVMETQTVMTNQMSATAVSGGGPSHTQELRQV